MGKTLSLIQSCIFWSSGQIEYSYSLLVYFSLHWSLGKCLVLPKDLLFFFFKLLKVSVCCVVKARCWVGWTSIFCLKPAACYNWRWGWWLSTLENLHNNKLHTAEAEGHNRVWWVLMMGFCHYLCFYHLCLVFIFFISSFTSHVLHEKQSQICIWCNMSE